MDFDTLLAQICELLQRQGHVSYWALKRRFDLSDEDIVGLKVELIEVQELAVDRDGKMLVWAGGAAATTGVDQPAPANALGVQPTPLPPAPHTSEAERRELTVMFSDLVDSTALSGQLEPEAYRDVLRAYQAVCGAMIQRFDGYIAQHLGDALLVYFGFPQAHEDDALRACHAALGMLEAMHTLNARLEQERGIRLAIRVGMHTGVTIVGEVGSAQKHELLALGEAPNVASRMQGMAQPNTVVISQATYRLVQGYFACEDLGVHTLKGVAAPQRVYRVLSASAARSRLEAAATRGFTPLVGREQEVGLLLARWAQARDGQGQVVLLSGEGGIGKSRLVQVLKDHVSAAPPTLLECRSSPYYQHTALYPITDLLQRTLRWQPDDTPAQRLEILARTLRQYTLPLDDTLPLFAALLSLPLPDDRALALPSSPQRQRQQTLEAIVAMLLEQAERQPVLFILEDLHWTDPSTLELLDFLIDQTPTAALLVLLTCRPTFQPPWGLRSHITPLALQRLQRTQIAQMAVHVADGKRLPDAVLEQIVAKTDGVPLFVEEMTKALLESGHLKEVHEQYELTQVLPSVAIPATLHDSLMARLDRLVTAKAVAQYAAVIGRQFTYALLQAVSDLDEATLQRELGRLVDAELVYQRGVIPQATYSFKHALVQDVAYASLLTSTRQQYHQRIAQVLEARFPEICETQPELLAHHYTEAGLSPQAIPYWQRAGQRAGQRSAHAEAIAHFSKGLELLQSLPDTSERARQELGMQVALGPALMNVRGQAAPEVEHAYARARALCQQIGDVQQVFPVLFGLFYHNLVGAQLPTARELAHQLLTLAQSAQDPALLLAAHRALGQNLAFMGDLRDARVHLEQAMALYNHQQHHTLALLYGQDLAVICRAWEGLVLWLLGYPEQALRMSDEACSMAQELDHPYSQAYALNWAVMLHLYRREGQMAQARTESLVTLARAQEYMLYVASGAVWQGWMQIEAGHWSGRPARGATAIAHIRQGVADWLATGAGVFQPYYLALLSAACGKVGQPEDGVAVVTEALAVIDQTEERYYEAELHRLKGELHIALSVNQQTEAEACFHQALAIARRQQAKSLELRAATSLSRLWQRQGKHDAARQLLAEVYHWFTEGCDTADLREAKTLLEELS